jgi:nitrate/nitrite-specific signal transduction histidine kinase
MTETESTNTTKAALCRCSYALLAFTLFIGDIPTAHANDPALTAAVNIAGRQRMLSQRIVKAYCELGLNVLPERAGRQLKESVDLFDEQLAYLRRQDFDSNTQSVLDQVIKIWDQFKPLALGVITREGAGRLQALSEDLLDASELVVALLEASESRRVAYLVNLSGRQRMLSQRLAKLYMLYSWDYDNRQLENQITVAKEDFSDALKTLVNEPKNTDQIRHQLDAVTVQWTWFDLALDLKTTDSYRLIVSDASEWILNNMDVITRLYEGLAHR